MHLARVMVARVSHFAIAHMSHNIAYSRARIAYRISATHSVLAYRVIRISHYSHIAFARPIAYSHIAHRIRAAHIVFASHIAFARPNNVLPIAYHNNRAVPGPVKAQSGYEAVVWPRPRDIATLDLGLAVSFPS